MTDPGLSPVARRLFGDRLPLAVRLADQLATAGITRGLIGPRELARLWDRHLLNCAVVADLVPDGARVVDVGSGAGLPGLVLACRRPDLRVDLVEPLQRRVTFLAETVDLLGLDDQVRVVRGRAEDADVLSKVGGGRWVTARAVAPLGQLVRWCLPLLAEGGTLLAMKGARAADEVEDSRTEVRALGGENAEIVRCGEGLVHAPATVVVIRRRALFGRHA
ncbi:MAG: 16S rRNA (guanine(527)-N(7))-methyltransferase RsmG [Actinomycetota bacterium]